MPSIMRRINAISRCQGIYRTEMLKTQELSANHMSFILTISANPGSSQEQIAKRLCLNKSTVTRTLSYLEEVGYADRKISEADKRVTLVYPTQKMLSILPLVKAASREWNSLICEGISDEDLEVFMRVLESLERRAKELTNNTEEREI